MKGVGDTPALRTDIKTPHAGVTQVQEVAERRGFRPPQYKVNCLAYNPFRKADDTWWISPTGQNPAYRFSKIAFSPRTGPIHTPHLFVGLNVEKGLTGAAATEFARYPERCRRWIMKQEWAWHRLVQELRSGEFEESARRAVQRAGHPITVVLKAAEVVCPGERSDADKHDFRVQTGDWHELQFLFDGRDLLVKHNQASPPRPGLFRNTERTKDVSDLPNLIEGIQDFYGNDHNWKWVDFYIGYHFGFAPTDDQEAWHAEALWERICLTWDDWLWPKPK